MSEESWFRQLLFCFYLLFSSEDSCLSLETLHHSLFLVALAFFLLPFGFCLGFPGARFGDGNSLLTLCIVQSLLQCPCSGLWARAWITFSPITKAILTVSSKVLFPVARYSTFHLLVLLVTWPLSKPWSAVPVARDTVAIAPVSAFWPGLGGFVFLFFVFPSSHSLDGDERD